jgi:hypothetical protein
VSTSYEICCSCVRRGDAVRGVVVHTVDCLVHQEMSTILFVTHCWARRLDCSPPCKMVDHTEEAAKGYLDCPLRL